MPYNISNAIFCVTCHDKYTLSPRTRMQLLNKPRWTEIPPSTQVIQAVPSHLQ